MCAPAFSLSLLRSFEVDVIVRSRFPEDTGATYEGVVGEVDVLGLHF